MLKPRTSLFWQMFSPTVTVVGITLILALVVARVQLSDDRGFSQFYALVFWGGVTLFAVVALTSFWVSRRVARSVEKVRDRARLIVEGAFDQRLEHSLDEESLGSKEMKSLSVSLDRLSRQLRKRIKKIVRQRNEQEAMFSSMSEGVLAVDPQQCLRQMNGPAAELLGLSREVLSERPSVQSVIRVAEVQRFILEALESEEEEQTEVDLVHLNDETRSLLLKSSPLYDVNGQRMGVVVVISDHTQLRRLETHRREFVANVSHELRTPLTSIRGFAETLLKAKGLDEKSQREFFQIIAQQSNRLESIIEDLLSLSKIEREEDRLELAKGSLRPVVEDSIRACAYKAKEAGIELSMECEDLSAWINPQLLEQALVNLVDNAIKYSPRGHRVRVRAYQGGTERVLEVEDEGMGIPAEHLDRLFERFYRVDKARSREVGGTGLGLSIVKHIVLAHGGRVEVSSEEGKGSRFSLVLPSRPESPGLSLNSNKPRLEGLVESPKEGAPL